MTVVVVLLAVAVAVLTLIVFGLLRTHAAILRALARAGIPLEGIGGTDPAADGPAPVAGPVPVASPRPVGAAADIVGTIPGGGGVKVAVTGVDHSTVLAFLSSGCRTCGPFWETFGDPDLALPGGDTRLVIVAQDPAHDAESRLAELAPRGVRTVCSTAAWEHYDVPGSPYFVLVDGPSATVIGSGSATGWAQVSGLLERALGDADLEVRGRRVRRRERPRSVDDALRSAGIGPGHPSLWPEPDEHAS